VIKVRNSPFFRMYFWLQWRWRRLRDVTLPTPRKEGSFASSAAVFGRSATIFVSRIVMKLGAWATQSNPIEHWHPVGHGDRSFANCLQTEEEATRFNCYAHWQQIPGGEGVGMGFHCLALGYETIANATECKNGKLNGLVPSLLSQNCPFAGFRLGWSPSLDCMKRIGTSCEYPKDLVKGF